MTVVLCELSEMPRNRHQEMIRTVHAKPQPGWLRFWFGRTGGLAEPGLGPSGLTLGPSSPLDLFHPFLGVLG